MKQLKKMSIVAKYTFTELVKSKILMNVVIMGSAIMLMSYVASEFTYGVPKRIALDFGIGLLSLVSVGMAIFFGANLLSKEIENRTVFMLLSRPISRTSFLIGRISGLVLMIMLNLLILGLLTIAVYLYLGGSMDSLIYWCFLFIVFESVMMLLVVVLFSLMTNTTMAVLYSICTYVLGHVLAATLSLKFVKANPQLETIIKAYGVFFPDFSKLNIKQFLIYNKTLPLDYLLNTSGYGLIYTIGLLLLCSLLFARKDIE